MTKPDQEIAGVSEGQILAGKYRVEKVLGVGGMGVVVAAQHVQLDERVAIKFLLPTMLHNQELVSRFAREARAAVKIKSEHVARVSDVGTLENGAPYMVMEFLEGGDLGAWIQRQGALPIEQAIDFVLQACVGVASAHAIGIIHRDLKPANLFCSRGNDGQFIIKVLDFGISKVTNLSASDSGGSMTHTTAVMGSPFYMSPEQMQSAKDVDARTDIWALGVTLYELLTGITPFSGESYAEIAIKVATTPFAPVRNFRPDAPAGLEAVLLTCLNKDKTQRYANVAELALALADFCPRYSRPSVERAVRIIQAAGLSASALALPASPVLAGAPSVGTKLSSSASRAADASSVHAIGTMAPSANTAAGLEGSPTKGRIPKVAIAAVAVAALLVVAAVGWQMRSRSDSSSGVGGSPATAALAAPPASPEPSSKPAEGVPAPSAQIAPPAEPVLSAAVATPAPQPSAASPPALVERPQMEHRKPPPASGKSASPPSEMASPSRNLSANKQESAGKPAPAPPATAPTASKPYNPLFDLKPQ